MTRQATHSRQTKETKIEVSIDLDKFTSYQIETEVPFLSHMLEQFSRHGLFDLKVKASGDKAIDDHHQVEDTGIVLGLAFKEALGERKQITRYASARVPMDDTLIEADIDLTTRPYLYYDLKPPQARIGEFDTSLALEFWRAFVMSCGLNLHISQVRGQNSHHILEASFKAVALALRQAVKIDPALPSGTPTSTKGML
ncbi:MAG: imidazoleglycerol-phosphate dehydratase HisB [Candidatus Caenarcaniphilales bacterium]|nr:imidazoleglycerol-phosphate dehydratase HisB [Candidatus Caenarcaniphilales bacterium]